MYIDKLNGTEVAVTSALAFYRQPTCIGPRALEERKLNSKTDSLVLSFFYGLRD